MSKARAAVLAEFFLYKFVSTILKFIPRIFLGLFTWILGRAVFYLVGSARRVAKTNLDIAFGEDKTSQEKARIAKNSLSCLALTGIEMIQTSRRDERWLNKRTVAHNFERVDAALKKGLGLIVCAAHYSNWEWIALWSAQNGCKVNAVVRLLDNPLIDREIEGIRLARGVRILPRKEAPREGIRVLQKNEILALMVDQNAAVGGVFVPFFGHLASTMRGASFFHNKCRSPVICVHSQRRKNGVHDIFFSEELPLVGDEVKDLSLINEHFEYVIRKEPDQYFWVHPRWKKRPPGETSFYRDTNI